MKIKKLVFTLFSLSLIAQAGRLAHDSEDQVADHTTNPQSAEASAPTIAGDSEAAPADQPAEPQLSTVKSLVFMVGLPYKNDPSDRIHPARHPSSTDDE